MTINEQLQSIDLFSELTKKQCREVSRLMTTVTIKAGRDLTVEGTPGREFLIIVEGEATVRRGGKVVNHLGPGDFLGELAVIAGVPRTATVTADTDMTVEVLNRREFSSVLDEQPKIARKVLVAAVKRIHSIDPSLAA